MPQRAEPAAALAPSDAVVHAVHDRYLLEVVEGLGLCPFARTCRERGRLHRPLLRVGATGPSPEQAAEALAEVARAHDDAEIVLLTFVVAGPLSRLADAPAPFARPETFDDYVKTVREACGPVLPRPFFMVGFHPRSGALAIDEAPLAPTPDNLVPRLRRSPDPVIQCVDVATLERVRQQAQAVAHQRMIDDLSALDPALRAIAHSSIQPDSQLSADIARTNFDAVGTGDGRVSLDDLIEAIHRGRDEAYANRMQNASTGHRGE